LSFGPFSDVIREYIVIPGIGSPDCIIKDDQYDSCQLVTIVYDYAFQVDTGFEVEYGGTDHLGDIGLESIVHGFEDHFVQVTAIGRFHYPLSPAGRQEYLQTQLYIFLVAGHCYCAGLYIE
jgi:hypothetical protein